MTQRTIYTKNAWHLGDCIYSSIMLKKIQNYIEENDIVVYFYCEDEYIWQVRDFNNSANIIVESIRELPPGVDVHDLWMGCTDYEYNWFSAITKEDFISYNSYFCDLYNEILRKLEIPVVINSFTYSDTDLVDRCKRINEQTNGKYLDIDFLINNGAPRSGQLNYDINEWDNFITKLGEKYNVVTTQKVNNIKCTRDDNLPVKDIAAISLNAKNIIAIESGVTSGLYNTYVTEDPSKTVYTLSKEYVHGCSFPNFNFKVSLRELEFLLE